MGFALCLVVFVVFVVFFSVVVGWDAGGLIGRPRRLGRI
jgi:hypothetical protein